MTILNVFNYYLILTKFFEENILNMSSISVFKLWKLFIPIGELIQCHKVKIH